MADDQQNTENPCEGRLGPETEYVKITSSDGHEFVIKRQYAEASDTLKDLIVTPARTVSRVSESGPLPLYLQTYPSHVVQKACMYLIYKVYYTDSHTEIPIFPIPPEMSLQLVEAANYLNC